MANAVVHHHGPQFYPNFAFNVFFLSWLFRICVLCSESEVDGLGVDVFFVIRSRGFCFLWWTRFLFFAVADQLLCWVRQGLVCFFRLPCGRNHGAFLIFDTPLCGL